jgi:hypothetical protein
MSEIDPAACADAYRALRERVTALVRDTDPNALGAAAPATPEWRVRDVLAHLVGVNTDIVNGVLEGVGSDAWTAAQVESRQRWPVERMLGEWAENGAAVEQHAPLLGPAVGRWLYDGCTHEHDIRQALAAPGARESAAVALGYEWATDRIADALDAQGLPALTLRTEAGAKTLGSTRSDAAVATSRFEIVRATTGRRSRAQVEGYVWDGPPRPEVLVMLGIFTFRAHDFVE